MDRVKIGKLIAECRKAKKLTQVELADMLGVTDKSVSKWENGVCLPDVSLYKKICEILEITLNEFFAGERVSDEKFKEVADNNLLSALENSTFILKDKIDFFKRKWKKDHTFELTLGMIIIITIICVGFYYKNELVLLGSIIGFIYSVVIYNRMMSYIERNAYGKNSNVSIEEFGKSINGLKYIQDTIKKFDNKEKAVAYLIKETGISEQECSKAYDIAIKIDFDKIK